MLKNLIAMERGLDSIIHNSESGSLVMLKEVSEELGLLIDANVLFVNKTGKIIVSTIRDGQQAPYNVKETEAGTFIDSQLNDQFKNVFESKENVSLGLYYFKNMDAAELKKSKALIIPVKSTGLRAGTAVIYRQENSFDTDEIRLAEYFGTISSLIVTHCQNEVDAEESRRLSIVKSAISTLSYSELEAIVHIFKELDNDEGLLVASKIADRVGITRSVIVNALRKFESAGVIESRSLGMKGTFIKITNTYLMPEIDKLSS